MKTLQVSFFNDNQLQRTEQDLQVEPVFELCFFDFYYFVYTQDFLCLWFFFLQFCIILLQLHSIYRLCCCCCCLLLTVRTYSARKICKGNITWMRVTNGLRCWKHQRSEILKDINEIKREKIFRTLYSSLFLKSFVFNSKSSLF